MGQLRLPACLAVALLSASAAAIPPSLPGDVARNAEMARQEQQARVDLASPEAQSLVDLFFERMGEGEVFQLDELFLPTATYSDRDEVNYIAEGVDDEGWPDIAQWEPIAIFRMPGCLAAAAVTPLEPMGLREVVLTFNFGRDPSGTRFSIFAPTTHQGTRYSADIR